MRCFLAIIAVFVLSNAHMSASAAPAQAATAKQEAGPAPRLDTPSGLPVPRFVSLKADKTNCRSGPSFDHPVRITYMRKGLPVMVVAETSDNWRKIRDAEGDECWAHRTKLSGLRTALVIVDGLALRARPASDAVMRARLGKGLIARVDKTEGGWLRLSADGVKGWALLSGLWGAPGAASNAAAQN
ncbi:MAG: SH3 domain-containing protein [Pseudomonadota bacterium]